MQYTLSWLQQNRVQNPWSWRQGSIVFWMCSNDTKRKFKDSKEPGYITCVWRAQIGNLPEIALTHMHLTTSARPRSPPERPKPPPAKVSQISYSKNQLAVLNPPQARPIPPLSRPNPSPAMPNPPPARPNLPWRSNPLLARPNPTSFSKTYVSTQPSSSKTKSSSVCTQSSAMSVPIPPWWRFFKIQTSSISVVTIDQESFLFMSAAYHPIPLEWSYFPLCMITMVIHCFPKTLHKLIMRYLVLQSSSSHQFYFSNYRWWIFGSASTTSVWMVCRWSKINGE